MDDLVSGSFSIDNDPRAPIRIVQTAWWTAFNLLALALFLYACSIGLFAVDLIFVKSSFLFRWIVLIAGCSLATGVLLITLFYLSLRRTIVIDADEVRCSMRMLLKRGGWSEETAAYEGVLCYSRETVRPLAKRFGDNKIPKFFVTLIHPDRNRKIRLYESFREQKAVERAEYIANSMNIPILEENPDGGLNVRKDLENIGQEAPIDLNAAPEPIRLEPQEERTLIHIKRKKPHILIRAAHAGIFVTAYAVFVSIGLGGKSDSSIEHAMKLGGLLFAVLVGFLVALRSLSSVESVTLTPRGIQWRRVYRFGYRETLLHIDWNDLERIRVESDRSAFPGMLAFVTDRRTYRVDPTLDRNALYWLRAKIMQFKNDPRH